MSGGSLGYFYGELEEHVGDLGDRELDDMVKDLAELFYAREWYLSGDTNEGKWNEARDAFKEKWFSQDGGQERIKRIDQCLDAFREEMYKTFGLSKKYCKNCRHWTAEKDPGGYGHCDITKGCLMHRGESCEKFEESVG